MAPLWRRSSIGSLVQVRLRQRRELPSGVWSPKLFRRPERPEITPEIVEHLVHNTCKTKINFGDYNGTPMGALPTDYLLYLANDFSSDTIHHWRFYRDMAKEVLRERMSVEISKRKLQLQEVINAGNVQEALQMLSNSCNQVDKPAGYAQLINLCAKQMKLEDGIRVHEQLRASGFARNSYLGDMLIVMYSKCGRLDLAEQVFQELPKKLVSSWTAMVRCLMEHGRNRQALELYKTIDVHPNSELLVSIFHCCGELQELREGRIIHACLLSSELQPDLNMRTAIFRFYAMCGEVETASNLFINLEQKSRSCWNELIRAYGRLGRSSEALALYRKMESPDEETFVSVLAACCCEQEAEQIRQDIVRRGLMSSLNIRKALLQAGARIQAATTPEEQRQYCEQEAEEAVFV